MTRSLFVAILVLLLTIIGKASQNTKRIQEGLQSLQHTLLASDKSQVSKLISIHQSYDEFAHSNNRSALLFYFQSQTFGFGNRLGCYLEVLACAAATGNDLFVIPENIDITPMANAITWIYANPSPASDHKERQNLVNKKCTSISRYPWEDSHALLYQNLTRIQHMFRSFAHQQYRNHSVIRSNTFFNFTNPQQQPQNESTYLPLIPDAVILFRCADILNVDTWGNYGFLKFNVYTQILRNVSSIFSKSSTRIYILSEPPSYGAHGHQCHLIKTFLVQYLEDHFPRAKVYLRHGYIEDGITQLTLSPVVICCPSTFCWWPALSNPHGQVYLKYHTLLPLEIARPNLHNIEDELVIVHKKVNFHRSRPDHDIVKDVIQLLTS